MSFVIRRHRSWMKAHRPGGVGWWLSVLWAGLGTAGAGYLFVLSTQRIAELCNLGAAPSWVGEPSVIVTAATIGGWAWVLLALPVLAAGLVQLRAWRVVNMSRAGAWAGAWAAGLALMFLAAKWPPPGPSVCGSATGYYTASVAWGELPACLAFLALGALMTRILARPPQQLNAKIACH
jgi:hypothetical protein